MVTYLICKQIDVIHQRDYNFKKAYHKTVSLYFQSKTPLLSVFDY